jgi:hypothetical protein
MEGSRAGRGLAGGKIGDRDRQPVRTTRQLGIDTSQLGQDPVWPGAGIDRIARVTPPRFQPASASGRANTRSLSMRLLLTANDDMRAVLPSAPRNV